MIVVCLVSIYTKKMMWMKIYLMEYDIIYVNEACLAWVAPNIPGTNDRV